MSSAVGRIETDLIGIGTVLKRYSLTVPVYQRSFSWTAEHIEEFIADLSQVVDSPAPEYFLGTVVLTDGDSETSKVIIDGQQRLATTTMLLAAVRNYFKSKADQERANTIESEFIASRDLSTAALQPRLKLNSEDDAFFHARVIEADLAAVPIAPSGDLIQAGQDLLIAKVAEWVAEAGPTWTEQLIRWVKLLENSVRVIIVKVPNEADAFVIFETLNDRGLNLTIADLLKNYLFGRAGSRLETVKQAWASATSAIEAVASADVFIDFLRHYWSSVRGAVRERELYRSLRDGIASQAEAVSFANDLERASRLYAALLNRSHDYWNDFGTETRANVDTLMRLRLEQNRPLLLAAMDLFTKAELRKLLRALVSWSVRGIVVGGIGGGKYERYYSEAAVKIRKKKISKTAQLAAELQPIIPSDADFEGAFQRFRPTIRLARYYLLALERASIGQEDPEFIPNEDEAQVNLEHVLPKGATPSEWPTFPRDEIARWATTLGNMCLLRKIDNKKLGNKPFSVKKPILIASKLQLTARAGKVPDWTPTAIQARQTELAAIAPKVWPRDGSKPKSTRRSTRP